MFKASQKIVRYLCCKLIIWCCFRSYKCSTENP